jgi:uracil-DNA glycosylase
MNWDNCCLKEQSIHLSWIKFFDEQKEQPYFQKLEQFLQQEQHSYCPDLELFPSPNLVFNSLNSCPLENVKVVLLGQDPYHNHGQAMGLSFSVPKDTKIPPSLKNIYKELSNDLGIDPPLHGDLTKYGLSKVYFCLTVPLLSVNTVLIVMPNTGFLLPII